MNYSRILTSVASIPLCKLETKSFIGVDVWFKSYNDEK